MNAGFKAGTTMCILQGPWQAADILTGDAFKDPVQPRHRARSRPARRQHRLAGRRPQLRRQRRRRQERRQDGCRGQPPEVHHRTEPQAYLAKNLGLLPTNIAAYADPTSRATRSSASGTTSWRRPRTAPAFLARPASSTRSPRFQAFLIGDGRRRLPSTRRPTLGRPVSRTRWRSRIPLSRIGRAAGFGRRSPRPPPGRTQ